MSVDIQDLKRSIDLVELFGSYGIEVKKRGAQHECACPFHEGDETPSLKITPERGLWNCFGCEAGGSAVDLVMKMDKVDVAEARKILLRRVPHIAPLSKLEAERSEASGQKSEASGQTGAVKKKKSDLCLLSLC
jgi:DNA primase